MIEVRRPLRRIKIGFSVGTCTCKAWKGLLGNGAVSKIIWLEILKSSNRSLNMLMFGIPNHARVNELFTQKGEDFLKPFSFIVSWTNFPWLVSLRQTGMALLVSPKGVADARWESDFLDSTQ